MRRKNYPNRLELSGISFFYLICERAERRSQLSSDLESVPSKIPLLFIYDLAKNERTQRL